MKKEDRLLRVGVLGAGLIAQAAHLEACKKARNVELYALCDAPQDMRDMTETKAARRLPTCITQPVILA